MSSQKSYWSKSIQNADGLFKEKTNDISWGIERVSKEMQKKSFRRNSQTNFKEIANNKLMNELGTVSMGIPKEIIKINIQMNLMGLFSKKPPKKCP